ncbi:hypothetical protein JTF08_11355 [Micrococcaceae bacterium RIT802]|nr:hypothetical protein [Micrococcaceae bacterium RIT 802]
MSPQHPYRNDLADRLRAGLQSGHVSLQDVWIACLGRGGDADAITLDAYIHGLGTLSVLDNLVLECACRETLDV